MEEIILKIIISIVSCSLYTFMGLTTILTIQFIVYQLTGISLIYKFMKLVGKASQFEIGG